MMPISIHALLAESDSSVNTADQEARISIHALLAESDRQNPGKHYVALRFLSTLSLRRATGYEQYYIHAPGISIHALLAESDVMYALKLAGPVLFLSTLSLRRATLGR